MARTIRFWRHFKNLFRTKAGVESIDIYFRWNIAPGVCVSRHDDGLVLFSTSTRRLFICNGSGTWIWERLSTGVAPEAIARDLAAEYGLEPDQSTRDVVALITSLAQHGLLTRKCDGL
jgi:hypothetical protein